MSKDFKVTRDQFDWITEQIRSQGVDKYRASGVAKQICTRLNLHVRDEAGRPMQVTEEFVTKYTERILRRRPEVADSRSIITDIIRELRVKVRGRHGLNEPRTKDVSFKRVE